MRFGRNTRLPYALSEVDTSGISFTGSHFLQVSVHVLLVQRIESDFQTTGFGDEMHRNAKKGAEQFSASTLCLIGTLKDPFLQVCDDMGTESNKDEPEPVAKEIPVAYGLIVQDGH